MVFVCWVPLGAVTPRDQERRRREREWKKKIRRRRESSWNMHDALSGSPPVASFSTLSSLKDGTYRCENALTQTETHTQCEKRRRGGTFQRSRARENGDVKAKISSREMTRIPGQMLRDITRVYILITRLVVYIYLFIYFFLSLHLSFPFFFFLFSRSRKKKEKETRRKTKYGRESIIR